MFQITRDGGESTNENTFACEINKSDNLRTLFLEVYRLPVCVRTIILRYIVSLTGTGSPDGQARRDLSMFLPSFVTAFSCLSQSKWKPLLRCKQEEQASLLDY